MKAATAPQARGMRSSGPTAPVRVKHRSRFRAPQWSRFRLRDTGRAMSEESTTPDLVELRRGYFELMDRTWDLDALEDTRLFAPSQSATNTTPWPSPTIAWISRRSPGRQFLHPPRT